jgi:hypothetical protein
VYLFDALDKLLSLRKERFTGIQAFDGKILGADTVILISQKF